MALLASACSPGAETAPEVPGFLLGRWRTTEPRYADRYFEIRPRTIAFGTGEGDEEVHAILEIDRAREGENVLFTIRHLNEQGQPYSFAFYYDEARDGSIRFKNQSAFEWVRRRR